MRRLAFLALLALGPLSAERALAQSLTEVRAQLQAALQRNLGRTMIEGALPHLDLSTGSLARFYPTDNHEIILKMDDVYVMCATLVDDSGREATVDYYLAQSGDRFSVIRTEIDNRAPLKALMDTGKAIRLE